MSEVTRFDKDMDGSMEPTSVGRWVRSDDYDALAARLAEAERERDEARWLIDNGERCFGTLWRDASSQDIYFARAGDSARTALDDLHQMDHEDSSARAVQPAPTCKECGQFLDSRGACRISEHNDSTEAAQECDYTPAPDCCKEPQP